MRSVCVFVVGRGALLKQDVLLQARPEWDNTPFTAIYPHTVEQNPQRFGLRDQSFLSRKVLGSIPGSVFGNNKKSPKNR